MSFQNSVKNTFTVQLLPPLLQYVVAPSPVIPSLDRDINLGYISICLLTRGSVPFFSLAFFSGKRCYYVVIKPRLAALMWLFQYIFFLFFASLLSHGRRNCGERSVWDPLHFDDRWAQPTARWPFRSRFSGFGPSREQVFFVGLVPSRMKVSVFLWFLSPGFWSLRVEELGG